MVRVEAGLRKESSFRFGDADSKGEEVGYFGREPERKGSQSSFRFELSSWMSRTLR